MSAPEPPVRTSFPVPPKMLAAGSAPLASFSVMTSLPPWPNSCIRAVLATVAVPPKIVTAPPLTRRRPAALRLMVMLFSRSSPNTDRRPAPGVKLALIAMVLFLSETPPM
jgi:hypothetical protein